MGPPRCIGQRPHNRRDPGRVAARDHRAAPAAPCDPAPLLPRAEERRRQGLDPHGADVRRRPHRAYFAEWAERFDLFHQKYPFFQRAGFTTREPSGINRLAQELSRGNNAALFDHTTDEPPPAVTPAHAARLVIAEQAFAVGGGKSDTGNTTHAPLVSGAVVLARGDTLFDTLWLNLTVFTQKEPIASLADDVPVWERPPVEPHKQPGRPRGYLDFLTWQSRTLRLHPEEVDGRIVVRRVSYAQGTSSKPAPGSTTR